MFYFPDLNEDNPLLPVIQTDPSHCHKLQPPFLQAEVKASTAAVTLLAIPPLHEMLHFHSTIKVHRQDLSFLCSFSLPITSHKFLAIPCHVLYCIDLYMLKTSRANLGRYMQ